MYFDFLLTVFSGTSSSTFSSVFGGMYSDICSDIFRAFYLASFVCILSGSCFWHVILTFVWHTFLHSIWHLLWHSLWHSTWHLRWYCSGIYIWHLLWQSLCDRVWIFDILWHESFWQVFRHSFLHVFGSVCSSLIWCSRYCSNRALELPYMASGPHGGCGELRCEFQSDHEISHGMIIWLVVWNMV